MIQKTVFYFKPEEYKSEIQSFFNNRGSNDRY
jgi:hypothetical protein